jgi:hypothetical protein
MRRAEPVLRALGDRLADHAEVVIVPGNHDRALIADWLKRRSERLGLDVAVPLDASRELERVAGWLGSSRVGVHYPGVWLGDRIWATHGHYLDRHLLPDSSIGIYRGRLGPRPADGATPDDYEPSGRSLLGRLQARLPGVLHGPLEAAFDVARAATMPAAPGRLLSPRMSALTAPVLGLQMRRASLPALVRVVQRLGVEASTVLFGHVHRLGPLAGDDAEQWCDSSGPVTLLNCGSWVYEPLLLHHASPPHPYWPGGALVLDGDAAPRAVGLLDDLTLEDMRAAGTR